MPLDAMILFFKLPTFALVASRLAGMLMFQPLLGGLFIPPPVRVMLVLGLSAMVTPFVSRPADSLDSLGGLALGMGSELLMGLLMGLAMRMVFVALEHGASLISIESGLEFGQVVDPTSGLEQSMLSTFYVQLGGAVFFVTGGARVVMQSMLDTFETTPLLASNAAASAGPELLLGAMTLGAQVALRIAAPVLATLFLVNLSLGFIARTVPQLNVTTVGFSLKGMLAFMLIAVSLPSAIEVFIAALNESGTWWASLAP